MKLIITKLSYLHGITKGLESNQAIRDNFQGVWINEQSLQSDFSITMQTIDSEIKLLDMTLR